jgi:hypothetical protein
MLVEPAFRGSSSALDRALALVGSPGPVAHFVNTVAPGEVLSAVRRCLPPDEPDPVQRLVRAKLTPGRRLKAEYDVVLPRTGLQRRIAVTWVAAGTTAPGLAGESEAEALRRGVLSPFHRSWIGSDDGRMSVSVAPVDGAFPHLVRLHDRIHLADVLRAAHPLVGVGDVAATDLAVEQIRYRPGQRHVLRVSVGSSGLRWFAKVYRDDAGRRAVDAAARVGAVFTASSGSPLRVSTAVGAYVAPERVTLWPEVIGLPLAEVILRSGPAAAGAVRVTGSALRLVHDAPSAEELPPCPDAIAHAAETLRTAQVLDALLPAVGSRLRRAAGRALEVLSGLPVEPPTITHGDFKCDNLVVSDAGVHVLDFDRFGRGDPAADIGKFLADLRWWTDGDGPAAMRLHEAFLQGYGAAEPPRLARARVYDALSQLRMSARRVPIQALDWQLRVTRAVGVAEATLTESSSA